MANRKDRAARPAWAFREPGAPAADTAPARAAEPACEADRSAGEAPADAARLYAVTDDAYPEWDAVYRDNIGLVHRLMFAKVGGRPDVEDLTAEVFLAVLRPQTNSQRAGRAAVAGVDRIVL
jgi:hypothetical protein